MLEIGAPGAFQLNSFIELKFKKIVNLFALSVERSRDEVDNRIEAIIRDKYTAVHPSVEWKFTENAFEILENQENDMVQEPPPIIFEDVFPLYGASGYRWFIQYSQSGHTGRYANQPKPCCKYHKNRLEANSIPLIAANTNVR